MSLIAQTPKPPYYAVIFTSTRSEDSQEYGEVADRMVELGLASILLAILFLK